MISIETPRLSLRPTHKNCWSIYSKPDKQLLGKLFIRQQWFNIILKPKALRLGVATEAGYGLIKALNSHNIKAATDIPHAKHYLLSLGFKPVEDYFQVTPQTLRFPDLYQQLNQTLGIDTSLLKTPQYLTSTQLVDAGTDCFNRPFKMHPQALSAWQDMQQAALADNVELLAVSAFRSMGYQASLIQKKLDAGQTLAQILTVNTAPGHSEHHTGCALDLTTPAVAKPLEADFATTDAYQWLQQNADHYNFHESYQQDNLHGIIAEPWHWCYQLA